MDLFDKPKRARGTPRHRLHAGMQGEFKKGRVRVPNALIEKAIRARLDRQLELVSCACAPEGISLHFKRAFIGVPFDYSIRLVVETVELTAATQRVRFRAEAEPLDGQGILAAVIVTIARLFVDSLFARAVAATEGDSAGIEVKALDAGRFEVDLARHPTVARVVALHVPIGTPILSLITIGGVEHIEGAVVLKVQ